MSDLIRNSETEVTHWSGMQVVGQIANQPKVALGLVIGQTVKLTEPNAFDWIIQLPDGRYEGSYTNQVGMEDPGVP